MTAVNCPGLQGEDLAQKQKLQIPHLLFLLFWILKPFYFAESGGMQISDFVFVISFIAWVIWRRGWIAVDKTDLLFVGFVGSVFIVNGMYYLIHGKTEFLMKTLYFVYNLMVVLVIRDFKENKAFLKGLLWASFFNLFFQLVIMLVGLGDFHFANSLRFRGTFNDPNQYSFSMMTSFFLVYLLSYYLRDQGGRAGRLVRIVSFLLAFYFIFEAGSTGMLLGISTFAATYALVKVFSARTPGYVFLRVVTLILAVALLVFVLMAILSPGGLNIAEGSDSFLMVRLNEKIDKFDNKGLIALIEERGIDKAFDNPIYFLFGSGEGFFERFPGSEFEIHSTFIALLSAYGILPLLLLFWWMGKNLKNLAVPLIPVFMGLFIESFTLAHQRQPVFWMLIVLAGLQFANPKMPHTGIQVEL